MLLHVWFSSAQGTILTSVGTTNLLSCHEHREYWIEWTQDEIIVGSGRFGRHVIVSFRNESETMTMGAVLLSTYNTSDGYWEFLEENGRFRFVTFIRTLCTTLCVILHIDDIMKLAFAQKVGSV